LATVVFIATPLYAQGGQRPAGWKYRFDRPAADSTLAFVTMNPGWHVTTGPATILYDPGRTAKGEFRLQATLHLFDPGQRREGYGIFLGGTDLEGPNQSYFYFLLRRDGQYLVRHRAGEDVHEIVPWTAHSAILPWRPGAKPGVDGHPVSIRNVLAIEVSKTTLDFYVNDQKVNSIPRPDYMSADGIVGLRVNHGLNLHVGELTVVQK
jgi:hypothetical protein